ncbi:hypothetical protein Q5P01_023740 [Channa striata]|uniref:Uncharacterized protein n=1 Tax=Channa striata TaxID=64152 RepID=A0AA88ITM3_CHASR|nr:hypothetical protein Q5P01_023740 [Channa striata]
MTSDFAAVCQEATRASVKVGGDLRGEKERCGGPVDHQASPQDRGDFADDDVSRTALCAEVVERERHVTGRWGSQRTAGI